MVDEAYDNICKKPIGVEFFAARLANLPPVQWELHGEFLDKTKFIDYVNDNPSIKAAMHTPVTADIVAEVFQWSRDTESTPPATMTQLYTAFTCKLLLQHLSSHKEEGSKSEKITSLEEIPADMKGRLLEMCRLAWEGIVEQQLTFNSDVVGGDTLGLMHGVRELYGGEDGQLSYHFIHVTLQEFLSAYHITQLPPEKQEQVIREHVRTGHLNRVVRFYFGLTKPNHFTAKMISKHLHNRDESTAYHWLFEVGDVKTATDVLGFIWSVHVRPSYNWSPLDYYMLGHSVARYQLHWKLDCRHTHLIRGEEMEMLSKGMASSTRGEWKGKIEFNFHWCDITLEGVKCFMKIPLPIAGQISKLGFIMDGNALNAFCEFIPKLTKLQVLSLQSYHNIGKGGAVCGAVEVLKRLHNCKTPLKKLELELELGEEGCAQLGLLLANTDTLEELKIRKECNISGEGAVHLAAALTNNHLLTDLDISNNPIGDIGAAAFGGMVHNNTALRNLYLNRCGITSEGCVQLAAGLTENGTLGALRMSLNHVGVEGAKALSKVIEENKTLRWLRLWGDDSLGEGVDLLLASLQKNSTLQWLYLPKQNERPADPRVMWL